LLLSKNNGEILHKKFYNIINYLQTGDVLVLNNSKVFPARLIGVKPTGGKIEIFLLFSCSKTINNIMAIEFQTDYATAPSTSTPSTSSTAVTCGPLTATIGGEQLNDNILPESESTARGYDCVTGPRFNREKIRSQIADACILLLGGPVIDLELDQQQLTFAVDESLRMFEEWAPQSYFNGIILILLPSNLYIKCHVISVL